MTATKCRIKRNISDNSIVKVLAPNGVQDSKSFQELVLANKGNKETALKQYLSLHTPEYFKFHYEANSGGKKVNEDVEKAIDSLLSNINNYNWNSFQNYNSIVSDLENSIAKYHNNINKEKSSKDIKRALSKIKNIKRGEINYYHYLLTDKDYESNVKKVINDLGKLNKDFNDNYIDVIDNVFPNDSFNINDLLIFDKNGDIIVSKTADKFFNKLLDSKLNFSITPSTQLVGEVTHPSLDTYQKKIEFVNSRQLGHSVQQSLEIANGVKLTNDKIESSTENIELISQAKKILDDMFGKDVVDVQVAFNNMLRNVAHEGIPAAFLLDKVVYLNEREATKSDIFHEAFHFTFRSLLSDAQIDYYLQEAKKEMNLSDNELKAKVEELKKQVPYYKDHLTDKEIEDLVYEEYMADKFAEYSKDNKQPSNWLEALFNLIKNFFDSLVNNRAPIEALFSRINNRGFRFIKTKSNRFKMKIPVFKLLKIDNVKNQKTGVNEDVFATESQSNAVVYEMAGLLHEKLMSNPDSLNNPRIALIEIMKEKSEYYNPNNEKWNALFDDPSLTDEEVTALELKFERKMRMYNPEVKQSLSVDGNISNADIIWEEVKKLFRIFGTDVLEGEFETLAEENMTADLREAQDKTATEINPLEIMDKDLRKWIGFTLYEKEDELTGEMIRTAVNMSNVYTGMLRTLASKDLEGDNFIKRLEVYAKDNPQTKAVLERLKKEVKYGTPLYDSDHYLINLFRSNLDLEKLEYRQLLFDPETGSFHLFSAMNKDDVESQMETWARTWNDLNISGKLNTKTQMDIFKRSFDRLISMFKPTPSNLAKLDAQYDENGNVIGPGILDVFMNGYNDPNDNSKSIKSFESMTGIKLSRAYVRYSFLKSYQVAAENSNTLDGLSESNTSKSNVDLLNEYEKDNVKFMSVSDLDYFKKEMTKTLSEEVTERLKIEYGTEDIRNIHNEKVRVDLEEGEVRKPKSKNDVELLTVRGRIRDLASGNVNFDETLMDTSFQDSKQNQRYGLSQKSFGISIARWLQDENYRKDLTERYPILANNYFLNSSFMSKEMVETIFDSDFKAIHIGDVRQTSTYARDGYGVKDDDAQKSMNSIKTESREGETPKTIDFKAFNILNLALFAKRTRKEVVTERRTGYWDFAEYYLKVNETKNTDIAALLPIGTLDPETGDYLSFSDKDGNFTKTGLDVVYHLFNEEIESLKKHEQHILDSLNEYLDYSDNRPSPAELIKIKEESIKAKAKAREIFKKLDKLNEELKTVNPGTIRSSNIIDEMNDLNFELDTQNNRAERLKNEYEAYVNYEFKYPVYESFHYKTDDNGDIKRIKDKNGNVIGYEFGRAIGLANYKTAGSKSPELIDYLEKRKELLTLKTKRIVDKASFTQKDSDRLKKLDNELSGELPASVRISMRNQLNEYLMTEMEGWIKNLERFNILKIDSNGEIIPLQLPQTPYTKVTNDKGASVKQYIYSKNVNGTIRENHKWFLADFFINHHINVVTYNNITDKDLRTRKDPTDAVKRNGGFVAFGRGFGSGTSKFAYFKEPLGINKFGKESEIADGQSYLSVDGLEFIMNRLGRLTDSIKPLYNKVRFGDAEITWDEVMLLTEANATFNSKKTVNYAEGEIYHKLSYTILTRQMTSFIHPKNKSKAKELKEEIKAQEELVKSNPDSTAFRNKLRELWEEYEMLWQPYPGKNKILHNMRRNMFFNNILGVLPQSASKLRTPIASTLDGDVYDFTRSSEEIGNEFWKLQLETPSGKMKIVSPSQMFALIDNEQELAEIFEIDGTDYTIEEVRTEYRKALANRVRNSIHFALQQLGTLDDNGYLEEINIKKFQKKMYETLIDSGADDSLLNFFRNTIKGGSEMLYDLNLPVTESKFQQLFISHFNKGGLQVKMSGRKVSLISDYGHELLYDVESGKIISKYEIKTNPDEYLTEDGNPKPGYNTRRLKWSMGYATENSLDINGIEFNKPSIADLVYGTTDNIGLTVLTVNDLGDNVFTLDSRFSELTGIKSLNDLLNMQEDAIVKFWRKYNEFLHSVNIGSEYALDTTKLNDMTDENKSVYENTYRSLLGNDAFNELVEYAPTLLDKADFDIDNIEDLKLLLSEIKGKVIGDKVNQTESEVIMTAWDRYTHNVSEGDVIEKGHPLWDKLMSQFGTRIPTQDAHSMIAFKVVDFLPSYMGDVAILPMETIYLSGEDFDIDAKYIIRKEYYFTRNNRTGKRTLQIHGESLQGSELEQEVNYLRQLTETNRFREKLGLSPIEYVAGEASDYKRWMDYLQFMKSDNKSVKYDLKELLDENKEFLLESEKELTSLMNSKKEELDNFNGQINDVISEIRALVTEKSNQFKNLKLYRTVLGSVNSIIANADMKIVENSVEAGRLFDWLTILINSNDYDNIKLYNTELYNINKNGLADYYVLNDSDQQEWLRLQSQIVNIFEQANLDITNQKHFEQLIESNTTLKSLIDDRDKVRKRQWDRNNDSEFFELLDQKRSITKLREDAYRNLSTELAIVIPTMSTYTNKNGEVKERVTTIEDIINLVSSEINNRSARFKTLMLGDDQNLNRLTPDDAARLINQTEIIVYRLEKEIDKLNDELEEIKLQKEESLEIILDDIATVRDEIDNLTNYLLTQALEMNKLPSTFGQFKATERNWNNSSINNQLLDLIRAFYLNAGAVDKTYTPASMTKIQGDGKSNPGITNITNFLNGIYVGKYEYNTALGQMQAKEANKTGEALIGPAAIANIVKAALARTKTQLLNSESKYQVPRFDRINFNSFEEYISDDIDFDIEYNSKGDIVNVSLIKSSDGTLNTKQYRIMDELSTILSAMTDNAKHNDAAKMNWTLGTLRVYLYLVSLGVGLNRVGLLSKQPAMYAYNDLLPNRSSAFLSRTDIQESKKSPVQTIKDDYNEIREKIKEEIKKRLNKDGNLVKTPVSLPDGFVFNSPEQLEHDFISTDGLVSETMIASMEFSKEMKENHKGLDYSNKLITTKLNALSFEELVKSLYHAEAQVKVISAFDSFNRQSNHFSNVSNIIRLHQGVVPNFIEIESILDTLTDFGLDFEKIARGEEFIELDNLNTSKLPLFFLDGIIKQSEDNQALLESLHKILHASKHLFISQSDYFRDTFKRVASTIKPNIVGTGKDKVMRGIRSDLLGFISIMGLKQKYNREGKEYPFTTDLLYSFSGNTIYDRMQRIIKTADKKGYNLSGNAFIQALKREKNVESKNDINNYLQNLYQKDLTVNFDLLSTNTRTSNTKEYVNSVVDAFRELMYSDLQDDNGNYILREFANDLFYYLIVKDGLQFTNGSYLRFIAPEMYMELSNLTKKMTAAFRDNQWETDENQAGLKDLLGMDADEFRNEFMRLYSMNPKNTDNFKSVFVQNLAIANAKLKEKFKLSKMPELVKMYKENGDRIVTSTGQIKQQLPHFLEVDLTAPKTVVANEWPSVFKKIKRENPNLPEIKYFDNNGRFIEYDDFQKNFPEDATKYKNKEEFRKAQSEIHWNLKKEFLFTSSVEASAAGFLDEGSGGTFAYAGGEVVLPYFITLENNYTIVSEEGGFEESTKVYEQSVYMLINHNPKVQKRDADGNYYTPADEGYEITRNRGVYVKLNPLNTEFYNYLYTGSELIGVIAKNIKDLESNARDKVKKRYEQKLINKHKDNWKQFYSPVEVDLAYTKSKEARAIKKLRESIMGSNFSYQLEESSNFSAANVAENSPKREDQILREMFDTDMILNLGEFAKILFTESDMQNIKDGNQKVKIITNDNLPFKLGVGSSMMVEIDGEKYVVQNLGNMDLEDALINLSVEYPNVNNPTAVMKLALGTNDLSTIDDLQEYFAIDDDANINVLESKGKYPIYKIEKYRYSDKLSNRNKPYFGVQTIYTVNNASISDFTANTSIVHKGLTNSEELKAINNEMAFDPNISYEDIVDIIANKSDLVIVFGDTDKGLDLINKSKIFRVDVANEDNINKLREILSVKNAPNISIVTSENDKNTYSEFLGKVLDNKGTTSINKSYPVVSELSNLLTVNGYNITVTEILDKSGKIDIPVDLLDGAILSYAISNYNSIRDEIIDYRYNISKQMSKTQQKIDKIMNHPHFGVNKTIGFDETLVSIETIDDSTGELNEYVNHSGGAIGSDTKWDDIGKSFGMVNNKHYWMNNKTPNGNTEITKEEAIEGQKKVTIAARQMGRIEATHQVRDERLIRNWNQVKYADAIFAITTMINTGGELNYGKKALIPQGKGGTGYAIQMAINEGKPVYLFDQVRKQWYSNINGTWSKSEVPVLTKNFAGIGTREINEFGEQAIKDVYEKTLNSVVSSTSKQSSTRTTVKDYKRFSDAIEAFNSGKGVWTMRPNNKLNKTLSEDKHFGNPFSPVKDQLATGIVVLETTEEAVQAYEDWLNGVDRVITPKKRLDDYLSVKIKMSDIIDKINSQFVLKGTGRNSYYDNDSSPSMLIQFANREPTTIPRILKGPITKEGDNYRLIGEYSYNILVDNDLNIIEVVGRDGKKFNYVNAGIYGEGWVTGILEGNYKRKNVLEPSFEINLKDYLPERRQWILDNLENLKGKELIYYKPSNYRSHADVLVEMVNKLEVVEDTSVEETLEPVLANKQFYEGDIKPGPNVIFVFGSNPEGRHGSGAAKIAKNQFRANYGQGEGLQGSAYAIPTKDLRVFENKGLRSISPKEITESIKRMYDVARANPDKEFMVAYRNTEDVSLNGYTGFEMIEMFNNAGPIPSNVIFSKEWFDSGKLSINKKEVKPGEQPTLFEQPLQTELFEKPVESNYSKYGNKNGVNDADATIAFYLAPNDDSATAKAIHYANTKQWPFKNKGKLNTESSNINNVNSSYKQVLVITQDDLTDSIKTINKIKDFVKKVKPSTLNIIRQTDRDLKEGNVELYDTLDNIIKSIMSSALNNRTFDKQNQQKEMMKSKNYIKDC